MEYGIGKTVNGCQTGLTPARCSLQAAGKHFRQIAVRLLLLLGLLVSSVEAANVHYTPRRLCLDWEQARTNHPFDCDKAIRGQGLLFPISHADFYPDQKPRWRRLQSTPVTGGYQPERSPPRNAPVILRVASAIFLGTGALVFLLPLLLSMIWAYSDARERGKSGCALALLVLLFFWPVGLLIWIIFRPDKKDAGTR